MITVLKRFSASLLICLAGSAQAADRPSGDFDYYVLALSWNASWCAQTGDARGAPQCDPSLNLGFVVHGLWPQYERGWPSDCRTRHRDPSRSQTAAMSDLMGSGGSAWHQWKKHGRCSGLSATEFYEATRKASALVTRPAILRDVTKPLRIAPKVIEAAFLKDNPDIQPDGITITCKQGRIQEARICLTRDFQFRQCAPDTRRDCQIKGAEFLPMK